MLPKIGKRRVKSDFEYDLYNEARDLAPRGMRVEYEVDKVPYVLHKEYNPDLTLTFRDGRVLYIEAKGLGRAFDYNVRSKMIAVKEQHPDKDIRIVFYRDGKIMGMKMTATQWAEKYGFQYAVGHIPEEWLV